ncbi:hypothetical protein IEQ34_005518 [Dendrobium chrysotoxum]|uniref:DUF676 domain-containing protein n=1 Tax=Dendrobium chrysotoxum TaxID=161865 RepID=A0AAV7HBA3_DENCH|nr:hypothetical protein IEQ34_005518 [Dendrobium chrysotoxum]
MVVSQFMLMSGTETLGQDAFETSQLVKSISDGEELARSISETEEFASMPHEETARPSIPFDRMDLVTPSRTKSEGGDDSSTATSAIELPERLSQAQTKPCRGSENVPFLFGLTVVEKIASLIIHLIFRRTGRHLFLTDNDAQKPPLLQRMVEDCELQFMSALEAFERRVAYSNVGHDHIVGWRTSSIRRNSELPKWDKSVNEKYPHIVYEEYTKGSTAESCSHGTIEENNNDMLEEKLVVGLTRLSWERVDVSFHSSKQRFAAHSTIQVKDTFMHSEGADVIQHMIDHFLI